MRPIAHGETEYRSIWSTHRWHRGTRPQPFPSPSFFVFTHLWRKSILVIRKKRGRPATGQHPVMAVRLPQELIERIDEWTKAGDARSRSDAIRQLIERGLDRSAFKTHRKPRQRRSS